MNEFLDSLTEYQRQTWFDIKAQAKSIDLAYKTIRSIQRECEHDFVIMSLHERDRECGVCGISESIFKYYEAKKNVRS